ncbi:MAG: pantoate--beta-alanine ligase [Flavobacteriaceae bacterium]|nr:pantoate--beta-alanine ligase [Flavobacteriaceae bacterium]|tara:strand:- start:567081 stop:567932 length:852 start_codon:yes stop_codon:yes gene_type:complete
MIYFDKKEALKQHITNLKEQHKTIGFVPTMGALHNGHLSLIETAQSENDIVVVSIFVNPTQFDNPEDLRKYPKTLERDLEMLKKFENGIVFAPSIEEIYEKEVKAKEFDFDGLENEMEGKFRTGHFDGVATIVKALFLIVNPTKAYFGEKDFQQLQIIKKMVSLEELPVEIVGCPIHRESDGLAMSSRNTRLTDDERKVAPMIYKVISTAKEKFKSEKIEKIINWVENQFKNHQHLKLEYFLIADEKSLKPSNRKENNKDYRAFIAVYAGNIRLIDNIKLSHK